MTAKSSSSIHENKHLLAGNPSKSSIYMPNRWHTMTHTFKHLYTQQMAYCRQSIQAPTCLTDDILSVKHSSTYMANRWHTAGEAFKHLHVQQMAYCGRSIQAPTCLTDSTQYSGQSILKPPCCILRHHTVSCCVDQCCPQLANTERHQWHTPWDESAESFLLSGLGFPLERSDIGAQAKNYQLYAFFTAII